MTFPNPFEAFYKKTVEGFDDETEDISNNVTTTSTANSKASSTSTASTIPKASYDNIAIGMLITSIGLLVLCFFIKQISMGNPDFILRISLCVLISVIFAFSTVIPFYKVIDPANFSDFGSYWWVVLLLSTIIIAITAVFMWPPLYFVEIFGNTIGYTIYELMGYNKLNEYFKSRSFPNSELDLNPLINIFSLHDFDNIFKEFIKKAIKKEDDAIDAIDFTLRMSIDNNEFIQSLEENTERTEVNKTWESIFSDKEPSAGDFLNQIKQLQEIYKYIKKSTEIKHGIGESIWFYLATLLSVSTSINILTTV